jgi:hypothetical protein
MNALDPQTCGLEVYDRLSQRGINPLHSGVFTESLTYCSSVEFCKMFTNSVAPALATDCDSLVALAQKTSSSWCLMGAIDLLVTAVIGR